ncbi:MAG: AhpC/TSA family protein [Alphaproteobacteria bacterium]|nr:MAG: AhpC/TSA family protein [Alphaproteobacteria bacterium]
MPTLIPRRTVPELNVSLVDGDEWRLKDRAPAHFTMVVFYRGLHCPICAQYLRQLDGMMEAFAARGVEPIAISTDTAERAAESKKKWGLATLPIGCELSLESARAWGLFISAGRGRTSAGIEEPDYFNEPGLFLIRPDATLYASMVSSMPFARPHFDDVLKALEFIIEKDYPARGEIA